MPSTPSIHADVASALDTGGMVAAHLVLNDATTVVALSGDPASYAEATTNFGTGSGKRMASKAISATDIAKSGAGLSAKVRFGGIAGGAAHVAGNPTVIAFLDDANSKILAQVAENGVGVVDLDNTVTFPAVDLLTFGALATAS